MSYRVTTYRHDGVVDSSFLVCDGLCYRGQALPAAASLARVILHLEQRGIPYQISSADMPWRPTLLKWGLLGLGLVIVLAVTSSPTLGLIYLGVGALIAFGIRFEELAVPV